MAKFGLEKFAKSWPRELSGGMLRRLELARSVARKSTALLLDEPFSALDPVQKESMHELLRAVRREYSPTIVIVTHDVEEAIALADRIVVLSARPGAIVSEIRVDLSEHARSVNSVAEEFVRTRAAVLSALGWKRNEK